ncbi:(S)-ureidoglycine aminohydrolase [Friedmanniella endophytica]|uniref:(S)-ureidoglycine aminohydrolase n=1 Tax=Microlunatus kandeliicorticis TaxID=1759536 RepID=A0A7W3IUH2_9ACTN|nr:bifunctional allantoicase/(S)-ureidoglycine aminohydrolase [Microlunatus kandeliicorticis]MBA8795491.1 (S)-ureidoglycine aminohydrolase [Microlunatus kandeliicorticis]
MSTDRPDRPHAHPHAYPHGAAPGRTTEHGAYYTPTGGMPGWNDLVTDRAVVTTSYAVIPRGCLRDIVTSLLPFWTGTRLWVLARPQTGFAETFSQYLVEVAAGGGSDRPETDPDAETVLFVVDGTLELTLDGTSHPLPTGGYAYLPPAADWTLHNRGGATARFHWIRKNYQRVDGLDAPDPVITEESAITPGRMPEWGERWSTTRFVDPDDLRHDMHVNIVSFEPGGLIPFAETHVMEHGLYILEGRAVYRLNDDWVEVQEGDFLWLRAFCPQACYAAGPGRFRYLLYKDVNRHMPLGRPFG